MTDKYITLIGAEQVQSAAFTISNAAREMKEAASCIDETMRQHRQFLEDWLSRLEAVIKKGEAP